MRFGFCPMEPWPRTRGCLQARTSRPGLSPVAVDSDSTKIASFSRKSRRTKTDDRRTWTDVDGGQSLRITVLVFVCDNFGRTLARCRGQSTVCGRQIHSSYWALIYHCFFPRFAYHHYSKVSLPDSERQTMDTYQQRPSLTRLPQTRSYRT